MEVHEVIRTYRMNKDMSQEDLAKAMGYTDRSSITKIESGKVDLPRSKIKLLARILQIPMPLLMSDEPASMVMGVPRLTDAITVAVDAAGLKVEPGFDPSLLDYADMTQNGKTPPEIYNVLDLSTARLARFTGDELRAMEPKAKVVREAFESRCITGTMAKGIIIKMIDSLPEDKLPIIEAYLEGVLSK